MEAIKKGGDTTMAQSIRKRLDGNLPQFLEDVKRYGRWEAMRRWNLEKSYLPVSRIILEETGNENYGLNPTTGSYATQGIQGLLREFVAAFANYIIRKESENKELRMRLETHTVKTREVEQNLADEMTGLMEVLKSSIPDA
ncbi:hypothetical protein ES703_05389 [subsurface metagenome]